MSVVRAYTAEPLSVTNMVQQVMSGDLDTCGIHLDGAFRYMHQIERTKSKYSPQARSLHRIYLYLRVIYDSTAYRNRGHGLLSKDSPGSSFETALSPSILGDIATNGEGKSSAFHVAAPQEDSWEQACVYGMPQSLLLLLARTTDMIDQVCEAREQTGDLPEDLSPACDHLESEILEWKDVEMFSFNASTASLHIIQKTTRAFLNALIIYFAQHIRLMRHSYLKSYIKIVLDNIESIENIKAESGMYSAPLYWPAFIAGSEAFDSGLQARFKEWYRRVETYRLGSARSGIDVLEEVWKDGPSSQGRTSSHWQIVLQKSGARLMLS